MSQPAEPLVLVPPFARVCWAPMNGCSGRTSHLRWRPRRRAIRPFATSKLVVCCVRFTSVCDIQSPQTIVSVGTGPSSHPGQGAAGFEGYEAVNLIRRYPATARRSALLR